MMTQKFPTSVVRAATVIAAVGSITPCLGGPVVTVGASVPAAQRLPLEQVDHSAWNALLQKYVDRNGRVDYASWMSSSAAQATLDQYLAQLSAAAVSRSSNRAAQLAFWINAYNAVTVKGILQEYPTSSIRNHTPKLVGYNIWKDLQLPVEGSNYSLEQIEHEVLRKMGEPRIHFAIVCASIGCPRLLNEAYTAARLDEQLTTNTKAFFADPQKFRSDAGRKTIAISPILKWFAEDFGPNQAAQLRQIAPYLPDAAARQLAQSGMARVSYLDYDWGLNDRSIARQASSR